MAERPRQEADSGTDSSDKEFSCPECGKGYESRYGVRYHLRNTDCVGFECSYCNRSLPSKGGMKRHQATSHNESIAEHDNDDTHYCAECDKSYNSREGLKYHYNNTECVAPVRCDVCGDVFLNEHGLKTHISQSCEGSGKESYTCDNCGATNYKRPGRIREHNFCGRDCWQEWFRGENTPNYNGGYDNYYGPNWKEQRRKAWSRDQYRCQVCGKPESEMDSKPHAHHIKPMWWFKENFDDPEWYKKGNRLSNLICLCKKHHRNVEGWNLSPDTS